MKRFWLPQLALPARPALLALITICLLGVGAAKAQAEYSNRFARRDGVSEVIDSLAASADTFASPTDSIFPISEPISDPIYNPIYEPFADPFLIVDDRLDIDSLIVCDLDSLTLNAECELPVRGPFHLPPRPSRHHLGVIFADGRPSDWDEIITHNGNRYWGADRAVAAFEASLEWNPALLSGKFIVDSLSCGFIVGGEVLRCGDQALQMGAPVLYLGNRLLFPLDFLRYLTEQLLPGKFTFQSDSLHLVQKPPLIPAADPYIQQIGNRTYIKWPLEEQPEATVRTDGAYGLTVTIPGVYIDPEKPPQLPIRRGSCLWEIRPGPMGSDFIFRVGPGVKAWRLKWHSDRNELGLTLSENLGDLTYRTYHGWETPAPLTQPDSTLSIVLLIPDELSPGLNAVDALIQEANCCLGDAAALLKANLELLGYPVTILSNSRRSNLIPSLNRNKATVCIILKPDIAGNHIFPGCRIVTIPDRPGGRPFTDFEVEVNSDPDRRSGRSARSREQISVERMKPWDQISPAHSAEVRELAWLLQAYLSDSFERRQIRREIWPVAFLEGLDMPALLLYVGNLGETSGDPQDQRVVVPPQFAKAIGDGIITFIEREYMRQSGR